MIRVEDDLSVVVEKRTTVGPTALFFFEYRDAVLDMIVRCARRSFEAQRSVAASAR